MPCDQLAKTLEEKRLQEEAIEEVALAILNGDIKVQKNLRGQVQLTNWKSTKANQLGMCEGCVIARALSNPRLEAMINYRTSTVSKGREFVVASHASHTHKAGK